MGLLLGKNNSAQTVSKDAVLDEKGADSAATLTHPGAVDARLPLTAREIYRLTSSWKAIKRNMEATGVEMFVSLFKNNSALKEQFKSFKNLQLDDSMYENEALANHGRLVMGALDNAISNLNDVDKMLAGLHRVGRSHRRFQGFNHFLFKQMEIPFLSAVKVTLGDRYSDQMENIYKNITVFLLKEIAEGYNNYSLASPQTKENSSTVTNELSD